VERIDPFTDLEEALAASVDDAFYTHVYGSVPPGLSASAHYASLGWRQGNDPNPWFSTAAYLNDNPDVVESGAVPLFHFLDVGHEEGRRARPSRHAAAYFAHPSVRVASAASAAPETEDDFERRTLRTEFNTDYYLAVYPDVAAAGIEPLTHFIERGWREGRNPNSFFSTSEYLAENADVAEAGINPFVHYLTAGRLEGRSPKSSLGFRYDVLLGQASMDQRMAGAPEVPEWRAGSRQQLLRVFSALARSGQRSLYVSVSHDNFTENVGGVQLCLRREADAFERRSVDHIHFFPGRNVLVTNREDQDPLTGVLVNGVVAGYFRASTIAEVCRETIGAGAAWARRSFAIHSLLGHNVASLAAILKSMRIAGGYFWLHDYASVCAGLQLLRNDVEFCDAPPPSSVTCDLCVYGERRRVQMQDHADFFAQFRLTVLAPSQSALDIWRAATPLRADGGARVHEHCRLVARPAIPEPERGDRIAGPARVAFLGLPAVHKGWPVYRELLMRFAGDPRYAFFHLGMQEESGLPVRFVYVRAGDGSELDAMASAVERLEIDVAVIWSYWPETFCLTAYEAVAGGALVAAPASSGNVARMVAQTGRGIVLENESSLFELFESGAVQTLVRSTRPAQYFRLEFGALTADMIGERSG
jgi:hypothetical protein